MRILKQQLVDRVNLAVMQAAGIMVTQEALADSPGFPEQFLLDLGIKKQDLRKLEIWGLAKRGYERRKDGWRKRWILINPNKAGSPSTPTP